MKHEIMSPIEINLIAGINDVLQHHIPGQVGRLTTLFYINCSGDTFQYLGVPTVLFEQGISQMIIAEEKLINTFYCFCIKF
jgi:hypothetical protein